MKFFWSYTQGPRYKGRELGIWELGRRDLTRDRWGGNGDKGEREGYRKGKEHEYLY
jgi:hypothetical protein